MRIILDMLRHNPDILGTYSDVNYLEEQLALSDDPFYNNAP
ncbi:MAG: hypothetical protein Q9P01_19165 [Anaerolineae bacterium]|nr:hypothetical protein [Anaerolineae bacterium]MDQ7036872.1 hypothetical protein [Anaerolineae bacterium]